MGLKKVHAVLLLAGAPLLQASAVAAEAKTATPPASTTEAQAPEEVVIHGRFIGYDARSATKLDVPVSDVPYTVASYTESFMQAIETTRVADLYSYMTGIQRAGNTGYDITIRGFKAGGNDRNVIMVDGMPGLAARFGSPPTANAESIEVVKGPASALYGQQQPGGFVNIITKKPRAVSAATISLRTSGYSGGKQSYDGVADFTGPIAGGDRFLYRLLAEYGDRESFRDFAKEKTFYVVPSLTWKASATTKVTWALEYRWENGAEDNYLVAPNKDFHRIAPITTYYQQPGDFVKEIGTTSTVTVNHLFDDGVLWNTTLRDVRHEDHTEGTENVAIRPDLVTLQRRARIQYNQRKYDFIDSNFAVPFTTGSIENKLLVGANGGRETSDLNRVQFFNAPPTGPNSLDINIYNPNYLLNTSGRPYKLVGDPTLPRCTANCTDRYTVNKSFGAYVSDLIKFSEHWQASLGLRYSREQQDFQELKLAGVPSTSKTISDTLPTLGLVYHPVANWSVYASYSRSFVPPPASAQNVNGNNNFEPEKAKQVELGVKSDLNDNRVHTTWSVYEIKRSNALNTFGVSSGCPAAIGTCTSQIGEERARGSELEINAQPLVNWQIAFGYAYNDTEILSNNVAADVGLPLSNAPKNNAHVWSRYDIPRGPLQGVGVGLGLIYTSERIGVLPTASDTRKLLLPSYTVMDLGLYYVRDKYDLTLKATNLLDKHYYESGGFSGETQIVPGSPRGVSLALKMRPW
jgi:iron complex outermembrane receptor protein